MPVLAYTEAREACLVFVLILLRQGFSLNLELTFSSRLKASEPQLFFGLGSPECWGYRHAETVCSLLHSARILVQVLMVVYKCS